MFNVHHEHVLNYQISERTMTQSHSSILWLYAYEKSNLSTYAYVLL